MSDELSPESHNSPQSANQSAGLEAIRAIQSHSPGMENKHRWSWAWTDPQVTNQHHAKPRSTISSTPGSPQAWAEQLEGESWRVGAQKQNCTCKLQGKEPLLIYTIKQRNLWFLPLCLQQMSLGVADLRLCSADGTCGAVKKLSWRTLPTVLAQTWWDTNLGFGPQISSSMSWDANQAAGSGSSQLSWHLMSKATDQSASVSGVKVLLFPWGAAFPNKQNANSIWIFLIPGSKNLLVTCIFHYRFLPKIFQSLFASCASLWVSEQHCTNK